MYYNDTYDPEAVFAAIGTYIACVAVFAIIAIALMVFAYWKILDKAGYSGAWSLLLLVPGLNGIASIGILLFLAFSEWPVLRRPSVGSQMPPPYIPQPTYPPPAGPPIGQPTYVPPPPPMAEPFAPPVAPAEPAAPPAPPAEPPAAPGADSQD